MNRPATLFAVGVVPAFLLACDGSRGGAEGPAAPPANGSAVAGPSPGAKSQAAPGSSTEAVAPARPVIALADVTAEVVPPECRGDGTPVDEPGPPGIALRHGGGVALWDYDGAGAPDLLATSPGFGAPPCLLVAGPAGAFQSVAPPEGPLPARTLGFSVLDGPRGDEPVLLGLGPPIRWARQAQGGYAPGPLVLLRGPEAPWMSVALDLGVVGIEGGLVGIASAMPPEDTRCVPHEARCPDALMPPGALALGPNLQANQARARSDPLWVAHPGIALTSAFAFGPVPAAFVTDLLGADHLYAFTETQAIADRAWHAGLAGGLLDASFRSRGADVGDVDGDGQDDVAVATERDGVRLYGSEGRGFFLDRTVRTGLFRLTAGTPWYGVLLEDLDGDGDRDVLVTGDRGLLVVANEAGGLRRTVDAPPVPAARGIATGDLDGDGDLDVIVGLRGGGLRVLRNDAPAPPWRRTLRPVWEGPGGAAQGVRVLVRWADGLVQAGERRRARGWLSASEPTLRFARSGEVPAGSPALTAQAPGGPELQAPWPDGATTVAGGALAVVRPSL